MKHSFLSIGFLIVFLEPTKFVETFVKMDACSSTTFNISGYRHQMGIIDSLKNALFGEFPDYEKSKSIIKQIRLNKNINLLEPIKNIYEQIKAKVKTDYTKKLDPYLPLLYETEATIISLNLDKEGSINSDNRTESLLNRIETKLNSKEAANAEVILLKENKVDISARLYRTLDENRNSDFKVMMLSVLKASSASTIEKEILKRVESYKNNVPVYGNMLSLLSEKGGVETFNYLRTKYVTQGDARNESLFKMNLKKLEEHTKDSILKQKINGIINK